MLWSDERYIRVYTRDSVDWVAWGWEAQSLFMLILRKVDRAGLLPLGKHGIRGLAGLLSMPLDVVERATEILLADGCVELRESVLVVRNFMEAQEDKASDAQRQRESRARARDIARAKELLEIDGSVTNRDIESQNVTKSHDPSHAVTDSHAASHAVTPSRAVPSVPSRAVPKEEAPAAQAPLDFEDRRQSDYRALSDVLCAIFLEVRGVRYEFQQNADGPALAWLFKQGHADVEARWRRGLELTKFPQISTIAQLRSKWNDLAPPPRAASPIVKQKRVAAEENIHAEAGGDLTHAF